MLTKENLLAIDCKHVLRAVSVLTFGSFTLYNFNFTIVYFSKKLYRRFKKIVQRGIWIDLWLFLIPVDMSLLNNYDTNYIVFLYDHICQQYFLWDTLYKLENIYYSFLLYSGIF